MYLVLKVCTVQDTVLTPWIVFINDQVLFIGMVLAGCEDLIAELKRVPYHCTQHVLYVKISTKSTVLYVDFVLNSIVVQTKVLTLSIIFLNNQVIFQGTRSV